MLIMQDLVNSQVSMNFLRGIATWCYFDEFHVLLRDRLTASYCVAIWKMLPVALRLREQHKEVRVFKDVLDLRAGKEVLHILR